MAGNFKYPEVREKIIDMLKRDLMGPSEECEILDEFPNVAYITGKLAPQDLTDGNGYEQEMDTDAAYSEDSDYGSDGDDNEENDQANVFKVPSSIGISFYIMTSTPAVNVDVTWGDYAEIEEEKTNKDGKKSSGKIYERQPMKETIAVKFKNFSKGMDYRLACDPNVSLHVSKIALKNGYSLVTVYVSNRRISGGNDIGAYMFQVNIRVSAPDKSAIFFAESVCREIIAKDEYYFAQRPIMARGRGCGAAWGKTVAGRTSYVETDFIPQYETPGVSAEFPELDKSYFSMAFLSEKKLKGKIISRLKDFADSYEKWIQVRLGGDPRMADAKFRKIGDMAIYKCKRALRRIREGITLLEDDATAFEAFCFMNRVMLRQKSISRYAAEHGAGKECEFKEYEDYTKPENDFTWRPFQIAFILMNLNAIVNPISLDREIVDLLYFPTGGGKTEAYLGLMAFVIGNRRLRARASDEMDRSGGVAIILRYTLRLLTTQQRDRITKMIIAAELIRREEAPRYGTQPISIGFWVGKQLTPNGFAELQDTYDQAKRAIAVRQVTNLYKQLLACPYCGSEITEDDFEIDLDRKSVRIYCPDENCRFSRNSDDGIEGGIPVYMVDEEIYARCPTVILSTVDKFATLPWKVETNSLFGRVDRWCPRHGYVAIGAEHSNHWGTPKLEATTLEPVRKFLPPELIIQDELHLITGPLGTIYGAYETLIEDLCSYTSDGPKVKPKYIVSTATIKHAEEQAKCLYGRRVTAQFPPDGFEVGDSFFIREIPVSKKPFRRYIGISAPGHSVKTALLRIYSILLQETFVLSQSKDYAACIDPYYTLVGYYNSIRELGGAARLLQDDIPDRIKRIRKKYGMDKIRYLNNKTEITSRVPSYEIPNKLKQLETKYGTAGCLDTAIATNMIAVGMDVTRLGLMVVAGQPKQNSEYIQATSRIGREFPGLVVTLYNPYRPRDLSHYENFTGYHSQIYRFIEGTTATPFSARARDRVMHALIIAAIRLRYPQMAPNDGAGKMIFLGNELIQEVKEIILDRLNIVKPDAKEDAENEMDTFIDHWKRLSGGGKRLRYYFPKTSNTVNLIRLMELYGGNVDDSEKAVLRSMRDVEKAAKMYYFSEE